MKRQSALRCARWAWIGLVAWQAAWLALLPAPMGKQSPVLAALLTLPLLLPVPGMLRGRERSLIWGGYLGLLAGVFGMMEFWAAPAERPAASLQLLLCGLFLGFLAIGTRKHRG